MKIAIAQPNPVIGDFDKNCGKMLDYAGRAYDSTCDMIIFPEMAVSGYPPQDLLEQPAFIAAHKQAMQEMTARFPPMDIIFGGFSGSSKEGLFNAAFIVRRNQIIQIMHKQVLSSCGIFDERRYFRPGGEAGFYEYNGLNFLVTVGDGWCDRQEADFKEINGIINLAAAPFQRGSRAAGFEILSAAARHYQVPLIRANQVGGHDSLLFAGGSLVLDGQGKVCLELPQFTENMQYVELDKLSPYSFEAGDETAEVYNALVMGLADYVRKCGFSSVILGLSGGIDSALTAAIAADALGRENVLGVLMPSQYSSSGSIDDARALAENLGCRYEIIPIENLFNQFRQELAGLFDGLAEDVTEQNLQARIRGNLLMALSNKFGHLLLATGNKSEMAAGYCTLYGDMCGGLAVIADVYKTLVYKLAAYVNRHKEIIPVNTIIKPPSAELKPGQRDQDELPDYDTLDQILELHLEKGLGREEITARGFEPETVSGILRRVRINEYKRKQAPIGLKITSKPFGCGRSYPNVHNFR
ncbi:MAG: NAD+ synthase [Deltaproteobacteria bacterium]|nr:MAG: NAD+ synthase [Deltaproteobacteria bacterium]